MSWSIKKTGLRQAIKAAVIAETNLPPGIRDTIVTICDEVSSYPTNGLRVEGYGHIGGGCHGGIGKLEIEAVDILLPLPVVGEPVEPQA